MSSVNVQAILNLQGSVTPPTPPTINDPGFESPSVGMGGSAYKYNPTGAPWTYSTQSGVAGNQSAFTSSNPNAPQGTQVAFLQKTGSISQNINFVAGTYVLSLMAAQRYGNTQTFNVTLDGVVIATITPSNAAYQQYTTPAFTVTAGSHVLSIVGTNPLGTDNTVFIDSVSITVYVPPPPPPAGCAAVAICDPAFQAAPAGTVIPVQGIILTNPVGGPWTYSPNSGLISTYDNNNGSLNNIIAYHGGFQWTAFLDNLGSISQNLIFKTTWDYTLTLLLANMPNQQQVISISLDGVAQGKVSVASGQWQYYTPVTLTLKNVQAGQHILSLNGTAAGQRGIIGYIMLEPVGINAFTPIMSQMTGMVEYIPDPVLNPSSTRNVVTYPWTTPPTINDDVIIPAGQTLNLTTSIQFNSISVRGNFVKAAPVDITYTNIYIDPNGSWTDLQPGGNYIFNPQPFDPSYDPFQYLNGEIVLGVWQEDGQTIKTPCVELARIPKAGDNTLLLASPVTNWNAGDNVLNGDSRLLGPSDMYLRSPAAIYNEVTSIQSVSPDGLTITLSTKLLHDHPAVLNPDGSIEQMPHATNLTRSHRHIIISPNPYPNIHPHRFWTDQAMVSFKNMETYNYGRTKMTEPLSNTNIKGRYANHFHHCIMNPPDYENNSIWNDTPHAKWPLTIHGTHWGNIKNNVLYNAQGRLISLEDFSEYMNDIGGNFLCGAFGNGIRGDLECGDGLWVGNPFNKIHDNIAICCTTFPKGQGDVYSHGFNLQHQTSGAQDIKVMVPPTPGAPMSQWVVKSVTLTPIVQFENNLAYGCMPQPLAWWNVGITGWGQGYVQIQGPSGTIKNFRGGNFYASPLMYLSNNLTVDGMVLVSGIGMEGVRVNGMTFNDYVTKDLLIINSTFRGFAMGTLVPAFAPGTTTFQNCTFQCQDGPVAEPMSALSSTAASNSLPPRNTVINNCLLIPLPGQNVPNIGRVTNAQFAGGENWIQTDTMSVINYNGVQGGNFTIYSVLQVANGPVINGVLGIPQTNGDVTGCPAAGLTNAQALAQYHLCTHGVIAPANAVPRANITGLVA